MKNIVILFGALAMIALAVSCNLEKEIDLDLPEYQSKVVLECYLEPGKPFQLALTRSFSYFEPFDTNEAEFIEKIFESGAQVVIRHNGNEYILAEGLAIDPATEKIYNYTNPEIVPEDFDNDFALEITLADGKNIFSNTRMLHPVPIDSIRVEFETQEPDDTLARLITYLNDPDLNSENLFRRQLHWTSLSDSLPYQDFITRDRFVDNGIVAFGTGFEFPVGDTVYNTIYHITPAYFDFLESIFTASAANQNPFGQPSTIVSDLTGTAEAIGIFTGLNYVRDTTIIAK